MSKDCSVGKLLCPFCSKELGVEAEEIYHSQGCDSCGALGYTEGVITVKCSFCDRTIYKKEFRHEN